jgi:hypothetical protein
VSSTDPSTWTLPRLRIAADGTWYHDDGEVTHPGILDNLRSNLRVDGGGHFLQVGPVRIPVEVEDAPWVVERVERDGDRLWLTLGDLSREALDPSTLVLGPGEVPYCLVKGGLRARWSRAATWQLLQLAEEDAAGEMVVVLGETRLRVRRQA